MVRLYDRAGNLLQPPRYFDVSAYRATIHKLSSMGPGHLFTAHYPPMRGREALDFLDHSLEFADRVHSVTRGLVRSGVTDLKELTDLADAKLGPYPDAAVEIGAGVRAHLGVLGPA